MAEMEYFILASQAIMTTKAVGKKLINGKPAGALGGEEFIGLDPEGPKNDDGEDSVGEIEKLREENKRLKKTLIEKF